VGDFSRYFKEVTISVYRENFNCCEETSHVFGWVWLCEELFASCSTLLRTDNGHKQIRFDGIREVHSWVMWSKENVGCGKCGVWKMRCVENGECGK